MQCQFIKVGRFVINLSHITHLAEIAPEYHSTGEAGRLKHNGRLRIFLNSITSLGDGVEARTISFPSESPEATAVRSFFNNRAQDLTPMDEGTIENALADLRPY